MSAEQDIRRQQGVLIGSDFGAAPKERAGVRVTAAVRDAGGDPVVTDAVLACNAHVLSGVH
ncbi:MAG TPA: hypothetical protein VJX10_08665 [Pseudonocardiaceae bacterium]|nr:hypothetical protein [Pseudonocardiaceae bacterium]